MVVHSSKPELLPSPGLESRILRALHERQHSAPRRWWPWLLLPPAVVAVALVIVRLPSASPEPEISRQHGPLPVATRPPESAISLIDVGNPLKAEAAAFGRDARRAGDFLLDCLPSLASHNE